VIEVKTIKCILITFVVQLFCNTITMFYTRFSSHCTCVMFEYAASVCGDRHLYV